MNSPARLEMPQQRPVAVDRPSTRRADVARDVLREVAVGVEDAQAAPLRVDAEVLPIHISQLLPEVGAQVALLVFAVALVTDARRVPTRRESRERREIPTKTNLRA